MAWQDDIDRAGARTAVVRWSLRDDRDVTESASALLARARVVAAADGIAALTLDEFTLAAVCASEDGNGTATAIAALCDATVNRAARRSRSVYSEATAGEGFGRFGGDRPMSTARAPQLRHVRAAVAVTRGAARGCSHGARAWFHQKTLDALAKRDPSKNCPSKVVLERWAYNCEWKNRPRCELAKRNAPSLQWVGPIPGIDHHHVLMFQAADEHHAERYKAAVAVLDGSEGKVRDGASAALVAGVVLLVFGGAL